MFPLYSVVSQFNISTTQSLNLVQAFIQPIALYNSENWAILSEHKINSINNHTNSLLSYIIASEPDKIGKKFLKYILGLNKSTTTLAVLGECGKFPLFLEGLITLLKFWHRISNINPNTLVKKALHTQMNEGQQSEWLQTVHFLLKYIGMEAIMNNTNVLNSDQFQIICKKKLKEKFILEWKDQLKKENSKLDIYVKIKENFDREPYLKDVNNFQLRKIITKFRCSDHKLEIEKGRHNNIPRESRLCKICLTDVENEIHFLCTCPTYNNLRLRYFGESTLTTEMGKNILACKEKAVSFNLANYLVRAYKKKETILST